MNSFPYPREARAYIGDQATQITPDNSLLSYLLKFSVQQYIPCFMTYDYRSFLKSEFRRRQSGRASYSLRAFARDIGVAPSNLSAILAGRKGLSKDRANAIAESLELSVEETIQFVTSVSIKHGRSKAEVEAAKTNVTKIGLKDRRFTTLQEAKFAVLADWYHFAILNLSEIEGFEWAPALIARRLGLSQAEVGRALKTLVEVGLLKKMANGEYARTDEFLQTEDVPSRAIRLHHIQMLSRAMTALQKQSIDERDFATVMVAVDSKRLPEIKEWLNEFREKFCQDVNFMGRKNSVYALGTQFFRISNE
jgi:uncharacterized protein (TIGR02147 family)